MVNIFLFNTMVKYKNLNNMGLVLILDEGSLHGAFNISEERSKELIEAAKSRTTALFSKNKEGCRPTDIAACFLEEAENLQEIAYTAYVAGLAVKKAEENI